MSARWRPGVEVPPNVEVADHVSPRKKGSQSAPLFLSDASLLLSQRYAAVHAARSDVTPAVSDGAGRMARAPTARERHWEVAVDAAVHRVEAEFRVEARGNVNGD